MTKEKDRFEELLVESFYVAIDAADPHKVVPPHIPSTFQGDVVVVGAGKAAASMAAAVEQAWPEKDLTGVVITRHGHSEETHKIHSGQIKLGSNAEDDGSARPSERGQLAACLDFGRRLQSSFSSCRRRHH